MWRAWGQRETWLLSELFMGSSSGIWMLTACRLPVFPAAVAARCAHPSLAVFCAVVGTGHQGDVGAGGSLRPGKPGAHRGPWDSRAGSRGQRPSDHPRQEQGSQGQP